MSEDYNEFLKVKFPEPGEFPLPPEPNKFTSKDDEIDSDGLVERFPDGIKIPVAKEPEQPVAPMPGTTVPHMPGKPDMPVAEPIRIESLEEAIKAQEQRRKEYEENLKRGKVLRIIKIKKDIDKRQKQKIASAIIAGISFSAFVIAALTSADDLQRLLHLEITNIASLREYVETIPTGILASLAVLALSISNYLGCKEFQDFDKKILKQYEDELNESPSKGL